MLVTFNLVFLVSKELTLSPPKTGEAQIISTGVPFLSNSLSPILATLALVIGISNKAKLASGAKRNIRAGTSLWSETKASILAAPLIAS